MAASSFAASLLLIAQSPAIAEQTIVRFGFSARQLSIHHARISVTYPGQGHFSIQ